MKLFLEACFLVAVFRPLLVLPPGLVRSVRRAFGAVSASPRDPRDLATAVERAAARVPFAQNCLAKALAAQAMFERRGMDCRVRVGARRGAGAWAAHAWLESGGRTLLGASGKEAYEPFPALEALFA